MKTFRSQLRAAGPASTPLPLLVVVAGLVAASVGVAHAGRLSDRSYKPRKIVDYFGKAGRFLSQEEREPGHILQGYEGVPSWPAEYNLSRAMIAMPCNYSGLFATDFSQWGLLDFDWSNGKQIYVAQHPMDCESLLLTQAKMVKAASPSTRVFVYRNLNKALPWYPSVQSKVNTSAYNDWFLEFVPGGFFPNNGTWHVPACDKNFNPPLCSPLYHDQDQTPEYPHGDGSCPGPCDCGGVPCGEYVFRHGSDALQSFLIDDFVMGPTGMGSGTIDGFYFDDGWANTSQPILPWEPAEGFCDHSPIGGVTEEDLYCAADSGLVQADTTAIRDAWMATMTDVFDTLAQSNGWAWQMFTSVNGAPSQSSCAAWFRSSEARNLNTTALLLQFTNPTASAVPPAVMQDLATFLLVRGGHAWIGYAWLGCTSNGVAGFGKPWPYYVPPEIQTIQTGMPLGSFFETGPNSGVFQRNYESVTVQMNCNTWQGSIVATETKA